MAKCNELTFKNVDDFMSHLSELHKPTDFGPYTCWRCEKSDEKFETLEDIKAHYIEAHSVEENSETNNNDGESEQPKVIRSVTK